MTEKIVRAKFRCVEMGKIPGWGGLGRGVPLSHDMSDLEIRKATRMAYGLTALNG